MANAYWGRAFTVYDAKLETGSIIPGGYIIAAVYASPEEADAALAKYRADKRYDVRPSGAQAIAEAAMEMAELSEQATVEDATETKHEIVLVQEPYLGDNGDYHASGYLASENKDDETGATVKVTWAAIEGAEEMDDESSRCDWARPESIVHFRLGDITEKSTIRN